MLFHKFIGLLAAALLTTALARAQTRRSEAGVLSVGARSTISAFGHEGVGSGAGGQFRIQFGQRVNTEWFADYITASTGSKILSTSYHIGWSVMYYPLRDAPRLLEPYVMAGHCFDYNKLTVVASPQTSADRWSSAVQAGMGTHVRLAPRLDLSLSSQYMLHLTGDLHADDRGEYVVVMRDNEMTLKGHLLTTISMNYKICRLWKR